MKLNISYSIEWKGNFTKYFIKGKGQRVTTSYKLGQSHPHGTRGGRFALCSTKNLFLCILTLFFESFSAQILFPYLSHFSLPQYVRKLLSFPHFKDEQTEAEGVVWVPKVTQRVAIGLKLKPSPNSPVAKVIPLCSDAASPACPQFILVAKNAGSGATLPAIWRPRESSSSNPAGPRFAHL